MAIEDFHININIIKKRVHLRYWILKSRRKWETSERQTEIAAKNQYSSGCEKYIKQRF